MIALQNLATGEFHRVSGPVTVTSEDQLLIHGESSKDFTGLQTAWLKEYPGKSHLISSLRDDVVRADWDRRRARSVLQQLQLELYMTGLPRHHWDRYTLQQIRFLEKYAAQTQNEFRKALRLLMTCKTAPVKADEAPLAPMRKSDPRSLIQQTIQVSVSDGKVITECDLEPSVFLRPEVMERIALVWRQFHFHGGIVPGQYAYTMQHKGIHYGPTTSILIAYQPEDFIDICEREIQAASGQFLDGKRSGYLHRPDVPPMES